MADENREQDLGHDGLVLWKLFVEASRKIWGSLFDQISDEVRSHLYDLFKAGHAAATAEGIPQADAIDVLLWCPQCFEQHVDEAAPDVCEKCGHDDRMHTDEGDLGPERCHFTFCDCMQYVKWLNPPHKSHRCNSCNHVWRPSDVPTNGVLKLETQGKADGLAKPVVFANGKDFDDAVAIASGIPQADGIAQLKADLVTAKQGLGHIAENWECGHQGECRCLPDIAQDTLDKIGKE